MTFRHPLRNEFEAIAPQLEASRLRIGYEGSLARAMLKILPGFVELLESERDLATAPPHAFDAMIGVLSNMTVQTIKIYVEPHSQRAALHRLLGEIEKMALPRLAAPKKFQPLNLGRPN